MTRRVTFALQNTIFEETHMPIAHIRPATVSLRGILKVRSAKREIEAICARITARRDELINDSSSKWTKMKIVTFYEKSGCKETETAYVWLNANRSQLNWSTSFFTFNQSTMDFNSIKDVSLGLPMDTWEGQDGDFSSSFSFPWLCLTISSQCGKRVILECQDSIQLKTWFRGICDFAQIPDEHTEYLLNSKISYLKFKYLNEKTIQPPTAEKHAEEQGRSSLFAAILICLIAVADERSLDMLTL
jgi:hypothetical protein